MSLCTVCTELHSFIRRALHGAHDTNELSALVLAHRLREAGRGDNLRRILELRSPLLAVREAPHEQRAADSRERRRAAEFGEETAEDDWGRRADVELESFQTLISAPSEKC